MQPGGVATAMVRVVAIVVITAAVTVIIGVGTPAQKFETHRRRPK